MTTIINTLKYLSSPSAATTLHTTQPTPSTVTYTVSTRRRREPNNCFYTMANHFGKVVRVAIALAVFVVVGVKFGGWKNIEGGIAWWVGEGVGVGTTSMTATVLEWTRWIAEVVEGWKGGYVLLGSAGVLWRGLKRGYKEESLTVIRGLGLQTSTVSSLYLRAPTTRFIPTTSIQDIFIHEAFKGFEVKFYMAVVVKGEKDIVVVFPRLMPRLEILEVVWRGARRCLWDIGRDRREREKEEG